MILLILRSRQLPFLRGSDFPLVFSILVKFVVLVRSKMSRDSPIDIHDDFDPNASRLADELAVSKLLAPNGEPIIVGDCFSQTELDKLAEIALVIIQKYCHKHLPCLYFEQQDQIQMYIEIQNSFSMTNIHVLLNSFFAKYHSLDSLDKKVNQGVKTEPSSSSSS